MMWGNKGYDYINLEETEETSYDSNVLHRNPIKSLVIVFLLSTATVILGVWLIVPQLFDFIDRESNTLVNVKLASNGHYLVTNPDGSIFTSPFPYLHGSKFQIQKLLSKNSLYQLKSVITNTTVSYDTYMKQLSSTKQYFGFKPFYLKLNFEKYDLAPEETVSFVSEFNLSDQNGDSTKVSHVKLSSLNNIINGNEEQSNILLVEPVMKIKGANIGSWFIPERWMQPSFYSDSGIDEYWSQLCGLVKYAGIEKADEAMRNHLESWLTSNDLDQLEISNVQHLRIPVGYWNVIEYDFDHHFVPKDASVSLKFLDWAVLEAERRGMTVLLDMHGAPGSQNGFDHSGCGYNSINGEGWNTPFNRNLTLIAIEVLVQRYSAYSNVIGFELLNEPAADLERRFHDDLLSYYQQAYVIIRKYSMSAMIVISVLWEDYYDRWVYEMREPEYYNVVFDWHKYEFDEKVSQEAHFSKIDCFRSQIVQYTAHHPLIIGEWSGTRGFSKGQNISQEFISYQIDAYNNALGWYYWNFKVMPSDSIIWSLETLLRLGYDFGFNSPPPSVFE